MPRTTRKLRSRNPALRQKRKTLFLIIGFFLLILSIRAILGERGLISTWRKKAEALEVEKRVFHLKRENERLRAEIDQLRKGGYAIERIAREDLGMAFPDEVVFLLPMEPEDPFSPPTQP